jgi:hypothetical protein
VKLAYRKLKLEAFAVPNWDFIACAYDACGSKLAVL